MFVFNGIFLYNGKILDIYIGKIVWCLMYRIVGVIYEIIIEYNFF